VCSVRDPGLPGFGLPFSGPRRPGFAFVGPGEGTVAAVPFCGTGVAAGGVVVGSESANVICTDSSFVRDGGTTLCTATTMSHTMAIAMANPQEYSRTRCSGSAHSNRSLLSKRSKSRGGGEPAGVAGCNGVAMLHRYRRCRALFRRPLHLKGDIAEPRESRGLQQPLQEIVTHRLVTLDRQRHGDRFVLADAFRLANRIGSCLERRVQLWHHERLFGDVRRRLRRRRDAHQGMTVE